MEFLRSFLRRLLVGKPVVASQNVGCFLWLYIFKVFSSLAHSHVSDAFSYFSSVFISLTRSHKSHISHIFLHLSCILITHSRSYNLSCSHFVISHAPLYVSLSRISYTSSHFSRTLIFPSRSYIRSRLFLAPLTCSKSAILPGKNAINRGNMHHWPKYRYNAFRLRDKLFYRSDGCPQRPCCWESLQWSRTFTHSASSCGKSTPLHYSRITDIQMKKLWNSLKRLVGAFDSELTSLVRVGGKFWPWTRQRATHSFRALWALLPNLFSNSQVNLLASHLLGARWRGGGGGVVRFGLFFW